jgi:hypothetical protein
MHARRPVQRIYFQPGIVGNHDFSRRVQAIFLSLLARVIFECDSVFNHSRQGSEAGNAPNFNSAPGSRSRKVP